MKNSLGEIIILVGTFLAWLVVAIDIIFSEKPTVKPTKDIITVNGRIIEDSSNVTLTGDLTVSNGDWHIDTKELFMCKMEFYNNSELVLTLKADSLGNLEYIYPEED